MDKLKQKTKSRKPSIKNIAGHWLRQLEKENKLKLLSAATKSKFIKKGVSTPFTSIFLKFIESNTITFKKTTLPILTVLDLQLKDKVFKDILDKSGTNAAKDAVDFIRKTSLGQDFDLIFSEAVSKAITQMDDFVIPEDTLVKNIQVEKQPPINFVSSADIPKSKKRSTDTKAFLNELEILNKQFVLISNKLNKLKDKPKLIEETTKYHRRIIRASGKHNIKKTTRIKYKDVNKFGKLVTVSERSKFGSVSQLIKQNKIVVKKLKDIQEDIQEDVTEEQITEEQITEDVTDKQLSITDIQDIVDEGNTDISNNIPTEAEETIVNLSLSDEQLSLNEMGDAVVNAKKNIENIKQSTEEREATIKEQRDVFLSSQRAIQSTENKPKNKVFMGFVDPIVNSKEVLLKYITNTDLSNTVANAIDISPEQKPLLTINPLVEYPDLQRIKAITKFLEKDDLFSSLLVSFTNNNDLYDEFINHDLIRGLTEKEVLDSTLLFADLLLRYPHNTDIRMEELREHSVFNSINYSDLIANTDFRTKVIYNTNNKLHKEIQSINEREFSKNLGFTREVKELSKVVTNIINFANTESNKLNSEKAFASEYLDNTRISIVEESVSVANNALKNLENMRFDFVVNAKQEDEPVESFIFMPFYQYCGPNNNVYSMVANQHKRLPINRVDAICMRHDISYELAVNAKDKNDGDKRMLEELKNLNILDLGITEAIAAALAQSAIEKVLLFRESLGTDLSGSGVFEITPFNKKQITEYNILLNNRLQGLSRKSELLLLAGPLVKNFEDIITQMPKQISLQIDGKQTLQLTNTNAAATEIVDDMLNFKPENPKLDIQNSLLVYNYFNDMIQNDHPQITNLMQKHFNFKHTYPSINSKQLTLLNNNYMLNILFNVNDENIRRDANKVINNLENDNSKPEVQRHVDLPFFRDVDKSYFDKFNTHSLNNDDNRKLIQKELANLLATTEGTTNDLITLRTKIRLLDDFEAEELLNFIVNNEAPTSLDRLDEINTKVNELQEITQIERRRERAFADTTPNTRASSISDESLADTIFRDSSTIDNRFSGSFEISNKFNTSPLDQNIADRDSERLEFIDLLKNRGITPSRPIRPIKTLNEAVKQISDKKSRTRQFRPQLKKDDFIPDLYGKQDNDYFNDGFPNGRYNNENMESYNILSQESSLANRRRYTNNRHTGVHRFSNAHDTNFKIVDNAHLDNNNFRHIFKRGNNLKQAHTKQYPEINIHKINNHNKHQRDIPLSKRVSIIGNEWAGIKSGFRDEYINENIF